MFNFIGFLFILIIFVLILKKIVRRIENNNENIVKNDEFCGHINLVSFCSVKLDDDFLMIESDSFSVIKITYDNLLKVNFFKLFNNLIIIKYKAKSKTKIILLHLNAPKLFLSNLKISKYFVDKEGLR